ncbi:Ger(x)C family spore germination protein [Anoxybacillus sp. LAT_35]|uniref:Ger(x)C family spore germination protein n=1 Tax=unclassified Anoxybacillus TaxID=2639704 RepID=UPI001EEB45A2|nr:MULTISPECIES: Ger(x)C family spore germination protein [unclassified Anoxybacillus]MCG6171380.1 Ger(x)C family spore germination protein [Anoxybacillus sp. LAT_11]MCG6179148.1 Ger(x)C family spore germination protein [Anoxybacillus sp. LAT_35]MCG6185599.1 Ger(x)C family spore germination protein [Anoxybacillus sp. LAT_26]MCG6195732.1 Ger(x)C family spore germination protein [Anoxybacillus sp. LAT_38]
MKWMIVCMLLLSGCVSPRVLERQGIITAASFDKKGKLYEGGSVMLSFQTSGSSMSEVIEATNKTSKGLRQDLEAQTSHDLGSGQIRVIVYGKELAEKDGIFTLTDTLQRDANIGSLVYLAIGEPNAKQMIKSTKHEDTPDIGTYLYRLIEKNLRSESLLAATLHEFIHSYYDVGKDPVLPCLSLRDDKPIIEKVALFRGDKFVGTVRLDESFYIKMLALEYNTGLKNITVPREAVGPLLLNKKGKKVNIVINEIRTKRKIKLISQKPAPHFRITVKMQAEILEMSEKIKPIMQANIHVLERAIAKQMEKEIEQLLAKLQAYKTDPIGFGQIYDHSVRKLQLTDKKWLKLYEDARFDVDVHVSILRTGTID